MPSDWEDMESAEREPLWVTFTEDGYIVEDDDETVGEHPDEPLVGMLTDVTRNAGENGDSRVYEVETSDYDRPLVFWGTGHINNQFDNSPIGELDTIGVKPTGETMETDKGNDMKLFDVRYDK